MFCFCISQGRPPDSLKGCFAIVYPRVLILKIGDLNSWLTIQNLKIARSRDFIFPEAFRLTLVKEIVRIVNVELRPLGKGEKREVVSDWTIGRHFSSNQKLLLFFALSKQSHLYTLYSDDSLDKYQMKSFMKHETSASGESK